MRLTSLTLVAGVAILASCGQSNTKKETVKPEALEQRMSYSIGYDIATTLKRDGIELDLQYVYEGLAAGLNDSITPLLTKEEMAKSIQEFQQKRMEADMKQAQEKAAPNRAAGQQYVEQQIAANPNLKKTESGLVYEVVKEGKGPKPTETDVVKVNYTGTTITGEVFDSNEGKEPVVYPLNGFIKGWIEGVQLMNVGSTYRFIIPADLAYGDSPQPGSRIEPGMTLVFKIELLGIEKK